MVLTYPETANSYSKSNSMNYMVIEVIEIDNESSHYCRLCPLHVNNINESYVHCIFAHKTKVKSNIFVFQKKNTNENNNI